MLDVLFTRKLRLSTYRMPSLLPVHVSSSTHIFHTPIRGPLPLAGFIFRSAAEQAEQRAGQPGAARGGAHAWPGAVAPAAERVGERHHSQGGRWVNMFVRFNGEQHAAW